MTDLAGRVSGILGPDHDGNDYSHGETQQATIPMHEGVVQYSWRRKKTKPIRSQMAGLVYLHTVSIIPLEHGNLLLTPGFVIYFCAL